MTFYHFQQEMFVEVGLNGIIVSNHGARQLDHTPATFSVLEEVITILIQPAFKS